MNDIEIFDFEQGSPEWHECRRGLPTASHFKDIMAQSDERYMRHKYRRRLAAERYSGDVLESFSNAHTERGKVQEPKIRAAYAFLTGAKLQQIGFARRGIAGCSPDALIGDDGALEIKSAEPHILFEIIEKGQFPREHIPQCAGALWVLERQWIDIAVGFFPATPKVRGYPVFISRLRRDESYIATLAREVHKFDREVTQLVEKVSAYVPD
jgi:hypothetical protein